MRKIRIVSVKNSKLGIKTYFLLLSLLMALALTVPSVFAGFFGESIGRVEATEADLILSTMDYTISGTLEHGVRDSPVFSFEIIPSNNNQDSTYTDIVPTIDNLIISNTQCVGKVCTSDWSATFNISHLPVHTEGSVQVDVSGIGGSTFSDIFGDSEDEDMTGNGILEPNCTSGICRPPGA